MILFAVLLQSDLAQAAQSPQPAEYAYRVAVSKPVPGLNAQDHPLPLPTTMSHINYEKFLFPFIKE